MSSIDHSTPTYPCGQEPRVGDLLEYGVRHRRFIVQSIDGEGPTYRIHFGYSDKPEKQLTLCKLIARHGQPEPEEVPILYESEQARMSSHLAPHQVHQTTKGED